MDSIESIKIFSFNDIDYRIFEIIQNSVSVAAFKMQSGRKTFCYLSSKYVNEVYISYITIKRN